MSIELAGREARDCPGCGLPFAFFEYHWPHCPVNPDNLSKPMLQEMEQQFSKSELAQIARHGPVADKRIGKKRRAKHA